MEKDLVSKTSEFDKLNKQNEEVVIELQKVNDESEILLKQGKQTISHLESEISELKESNLKLEE